MIGVLVALVAIQVAHSDATAAISSGTGAEAVPARPEVPSTPAPVQGATPRQDAGSSSTTAPAGPPSTAPTIANKSRQWYYLADLNAVSTQRGSAQCTGGCTGGSSDPATVAGTLYPQSIEMPMSPSGGISSSEWDVAKSCSVLETTVGFTQGSVDAEAIFAVSKDGGDPTAVVRVASGASKHLRVSVEGVVRFKLLAHVTRTQGTAAYEQKAAWGDARLWCSREPPSDP